MIVDPFDNHVSRQLLKNGNYNPQEISSIKKMLKKSDKVLVCGAHIGALVIPIAPSVKKIIAIEASPKNFELLYLNTLINKINNIEVYNFAAAEKSGNISFVMNIENSGGSKRLPIRFKDDYFYDSPDTVKVKSFSLDSQFKNNFDVVIMDIEGSEYFAILGMQRILKNSRIFIFEFVPNHLTDVANVSISEFVSKIPLNHFNKAYFPRLGITTQAYNLEKILHKISEHGSYEDGIILF